MENLNSYSKSSTVRVLTPIKRLGLGRKRKSITSPSGCPNKILNKDDSLEVQPSENLKIKCEDHNTIALPNKINDEEVTENIDYSKHITEIRKRIDQKKEMIDVIKKKTDKIVELEDLILLWKNGCKTAFFHLDQLLKEKHGENMKSKVWLKSLGIWKFMVKNFHDDPDFSLSDDSD
ncbi:hypothetical protein RUM43_007076 [Polyplax serrata]|uniref:Swi5-dependent recombination DNA repair protein 1 homolog n=1 Tax=Polyplax serrata TaxID=468196 RepID=A0AAN8S7M7_POLSC